MASAEYFAMDADRATGCHRVVKCFRDYADDIEAVSIHYAVTPLDSHPDWEHSRATRYMPRVDGPLRRKELKLPLSIPGSSGEQINRYLLHYYFEVCRAGDRQYSPLYSEEVMTEQRMELVSKND